MADFALKSGAGAIVLANRAWSLGEKMVPTRADATSNVAIAKKAVWEVTTAATSNGTPTWPASITYDTTTVTQNGVTWTARKPGYSSGSTFNWAFASIYLDYVIKAMAAGDRLFVSNNHAESISDTSVTCTGVGTVASRIQLLCTNDGASPPTALATGAVVDHTGTGGSYQMQGSVYGVGITFKSAGFIDIVNATSGNISQDWDTCSFWPTTAGSSSYMNLGCTSNALTNVYYKNCTWKFAGTQNHLNVYGNVRMDGGSFVSGSSTPANGIFQFAGDRSAGFLHSTGLDASNLGSTVNLGGNSTSVAPGWMLWRQIKLPTSWTGLVSAAPPGPGQNFKMHNGDATGTNYRSIEVNYTGTVSTETTIVRTGGASDGTTSLAWKVASGANALTFPHTAVETPETGIWNDNSGSSKTLTVYIVHDSQGTGASSALKNDECYLEARYIGASGAPLGSLGSNAKADVLATAADQTSDSSTWTTTGLTTPVKQKLTITFTPQQKGEVLWKVVFPRGTSKTVYVCRKGEIS